MKPLETLRLIQCSEQPLNNYSLKWPELIDFCAVQDKVLWSAREAIAIDKDCFYRTRTACVYF